MSLWAEDDSAAYLVPGQPAFHGKPAIHAVMTALMSQLHTAGMTDSTFDVVLHQDPTVTEPSLLMLVGEQSISMGGGAVGEGGRTETVHGLGSMVRVDGQWKVHTIGIVNTTPQLHDMLHTLGTQSNEE